MTNPLDDLMSTGVPSATFPDKGTVVEGTILKLEKTQQRDMTTGQPKVWEDGNPMWQFVFTLRTELRDAQIEGDDGIRKVYAKAQMEKAIPDAIRQSGHKGDIVGGTLAVKFTREEPAKTRGFNPQKVYAAKFTPPAETDEFTEGGDLSQPEDYPEEPF